MVENTTMSTKQKVIAVLTVVIFAFIIYEVIGLFSSSEKSSTPVITQTKKISPAEQKQPAAAAPKIAQPQQAAVTTVNTASPLPTTRQIIDTQSQQQQQQAYLDSVNQLQLLKVKKDIAETNQAIASARLATETANKNMSDLLTQPAVMPQPNGNYADQTTGTAAQTTGQPAANMPSAKAQVLDVPFTVVSVSMQYNHWNAVLGYQDKLYSVSMGDSLFDGSKDVSINKNGVVLVKDGKRRRISIQTTI